MNKVEHDVLLVGQLKSLAINFDGLAKRIEEGKISGAELKATLVFLKQLVPDQRWTE